MHLKIGTTLQGGEFKIEKVLGQGGFGITYLAHQHSLNRSVAVKEFFMSDYCQRSHDDGCTVSVPTIANREQVEKSKQRFLREAQFTARLIHPHIVTIYCIFEENGTIYYVMEFLCGGSLFALANGAPLSESKAVDYTRQIASALSLMHSHEQTHLDVKPGNIMLRDDKSAVLIDFGLTKQFEDGHQLTSTHIAFTPNYAPLEQHKGVKEFLPTIDVYALGATLYFLLTGKNPPMADEVFNDGLPDLPSNVSSCTRRAVEMAMQPKSKDRPQSMKAFIDMLPSSATSEQTTPFAPQAPKTQVRPNLDISKVDVSKLKKSHSYNQKPQYNDEAKTALISDKKPSIRKKSQNKLMMIIGAIVLVVIVTLLLNLQNFKSNNSSLLSEADVTEETGTSSEVLTFTVGDVLFNMVKVKGGTFTMGATVEQGHDAEDIEKPAHQVTLSDYMIGQTEVTQELWRAVMGSNPSSYKGDKLPVECVSWVDCQEFIKKLNERTELNFRLPTEAEWEYAARGGNKSKGYKYSGSNDIGSVAWYEETTNESGTKLVATKAPNELGLYDMSGNVWEWCCDWYGCYSSSPQTDPRGPSFGSYRVGRGGGWKESAQLCRVSFRGGFSSNRRINLIGLRLVLKEGEEPYTPEEPEFANKTIAVNGVSFDMVAVEGGTFTMGATAEQGLDADFDEMTTHQVTLSDYMIGKTEVTQELWQAVMGSNLSCFESDKFPVECVSWHECQEFISKLNSLTGLKFRLPTEAEWEYAARGGNKSKGYKYSGSNDIASVAWFSGNSSSRTHNVATKAPNELGLYDMSGNVYEWCSDRYGIYSRESQTNPKGPSSGSFRVVRGGSWNNKNARSYRVSRRDRNRPDSRSRYLGLRLAL